MSPTSVAIPETINHDEPTQATGADDYVTAPEPVSRDTIEQERQLLGFALAYPEAMPDDVLTMPGEVLSSPAHQVLWEIAADRAARGLPSDMPAVAGQLREDHREYPNLPDKASQYMLTYGLNLHGVVLSTLVDEITAGHRARKTEQALTRAWQMMAAGRDDLAREVMSASDPDEGVTDPWVGFDQAWQQAMDDAENPAAIVSTPWPKLNVEYLNGGLKSREVHIAAGLAGTGKTALAQQFTDHAARNGVSVGVFSMEMSLGDFARRTVSTSGKIDMAETMRPKLDMHAESYAKAAEVVEALTRENGNVKVIDDGGLTIRRLRSYARMGVRRHGLGAFVVDYAQLVEHDNSKLDERERLEDVVRELKKLAKELDVPVLLLVQPNRNAVVQGRKLTMSDMYGSGALERYAATVILLNKVTEKSDDGEVEDVPLIEFTVDKNRYGKTGSVQMLADLSRQRFEEM